jgi:hypothetical protein
MKLFAAALPGLLSMTAAAADPSLPGFPERKIGMSPLSLAELGKLGPMGVLADAGSWFQQKSSHASTTKPLVSHMPILPPKSDADSKSVKAPDESIDYKLIVRSPRIEPAK